MSALGIGLAGLGVLTAAGCGVGWWCTRDWRVVGTAAACCLCGGTAVGCYVVALCMLGEAF